MQVFLGVSKDVLNDLLHEYAVVSLSCHSRVRPSEHLTDTCMSCIAATTTSLTASSSNSLLVPGCEALDSAAYANNFVLSSFRVSKEIFSRVIAHVQDYRTSQEWQ